MMHDNVHFAVSKFCVSTPFVTVSANFQNFFNLLSFVFQSLLSQFQLFFRAFLTSKKSKLFTCGNQINTQEKFPQH